ncbi:SUKH-3 domain-containing protein, partial [Streptomyces triticirhizae]
MTGRSPDHTPCRQGPLAERFDATENPPGMETFDRERWSPKTEQALRAAGWTPDRQVPTQEWERILRESDGFEAHQATRTFLSESGELAFDLSGMSNTMALGPFSTNPLEGQWEADICECMSEDVGTSSTSSAKEIEGICCSEWPGMGLYFAASTRWNSSQRAVTRLWTNSSSDTAEKPFPHKQQAALVCPSSDSSTHVAPFSTLATCTRASCGSGMAQVSDELLDQGRRLGKRRGIEAESLGRHRAQNLTNHPFRRVTDPPGDRCNTAPTPTGRTARSAPSSTASAATVPSTSTTVAGSPACER